jgi:hypothetical protein
MIFILLMICLFFVILSNSGGSQLNIDPCLPTGRLPFSQDDNIPILHNYKLHCIELTLI